MVDEDEQVPHEEEPPPHDLPIDVAIVSKQQGILPLQSSFPQQNFLQDWHLTFKNFYENSIQMDRDIDHKYSVESPQMEEEKNHGIFSYTKVEKFCEHICPHIGSTIAKKKSAEFCKNISLFLQEETRTLSKLYARHLEDYHAYAKAILRLGSNPPWNKAQAAMQEFLECIPHFLYRKNKLYDLQATVLRRIQECDLYETLESMRHQKDDSNNGIICVTNIFQNAICRDTPEPMYPERWIVISKENGAHSEQECSLIEEFYTNYAQLLNKNFLFLQNLISGFETFRLFAELTTSSDNSAIWLFKAMADPKMRKLIKRPA